MYSPNWVSVGGWRSKTYETGLETSIGFWMVTVSENSPKITELCGKDSPRKKKLSLASFSTLFKDESNQ